MVKSTFSPWQHMAPVRSSRPPDKIYWYTHTTPPRNTSIELSMDLDVPALGLLFMQRPEADGAEVYTPGDAYITYLNGILVIKSPAGEKVQYESIRIGFRVEAKIHHTLRQGYDELYHVYNEVPGGVLDLTDSEQRISFSFAIPSTTAPKEWHNDGFLLTYLYAEVIGASVSSTKNSFPLSLSRLMPFASVQKDLPAYDAATLPSRAQMENTTVLKGTYFAERSIRLVYNPDPEGRVNTLDERWTGQSSDIGAYDIRVFSDVWTISSYIRLNIALCDIPPTSTIFSVTLSLLQTHAIRDPMNSTTPRISTLRTLMLSSGSQPARHDRHPGVSYPALWRGTAAGGTSSGVLLMDMEDRVLQDDGLIRPSTVAGVETPIHISHVLDIDISFSSSGVDGNGQAMDCLGPGELRVMRIRRKVMLPSCCILPKIVDLPNYNSPEEWQPQPYPPRPWGRCACGLSTKEIQERMRASIKADGAVPEGATASTKPIL